MSRHKRPHRQAELLSSSINYDPEGDNRIVIVSWGWKNGKSVANFHWLHAHEADPDGDDTWEYAYHIYAPPCK